MRRISGFLYSYANWTVCIILTVIMIAYASIAMGHASAAYEDHVAEGLRVLDLKLGYSVEYATTLFQSMGTDGLKAYLEMVQVWDNLFPLVYGLMNLFWMSFIFKPITKRLPAIKYINLLPLIPMLIDWIENAFVGRLLIQYMSQGLLVEKDVAIASLVTQIKWVGTSLNYLVILIGIGMLIYFRVSAKKKS